MRLGAAPTVVAGGTQAIDIQATNQAASAQSVVNDYSAIGVPATREIVPQESSPSPYAGPMAPPPASDNSTLLLFLAVAAALGLVLLRNRKKR